MLNQISAFIPQTLGIAKPTTRVLTDRQKKIIGIALVAISFIVLAILTAWQCFRKPKTLEITPEGPVDIKSAESPKIKFPVENKPVEIKNIENADEKFNDNPENQTLDKVKDIGMEIIDMADTHPHKKPSEYSNVEKAMDLMFESRGLKWGVWIKNMTKAKKAERFEELKAVIKKLTKDEVNEAVEYRDGMMGRTQTLLLQAIMCISNPTHRLEIVEMLVKKGADPYIEGYYYEPVLVKAWALNTKDEKLIQVIEDALKAHKMAHLIEKGIAIPV